MQSNLVKQIILDFIKKKNHKKNLLFQTDFISDFYIFVIIPFCL